jgi:hypothetical protein
MATIDPSIAMGYKPVQIENPLNQLAAMTQIQTGQQGQQLNALKIQEAERELGENKDIRNYLVSANLKTPEGRAGLRQFGKTGLAYEKLITDQEKADLERKELGGKISKQEMDSNTQKLRNLSRNPSPANIQAYFEDFVIDNPNEPQKIANAQRTRDYLLSVDIPTRNAYLSSLGATASDLKPVIQNMDVGGSIIPRVLDAYTGLPISEQKPILKTPTQGELLVDKRTREAVERGERKDIVANTVTAADGTVTQFNKFGDIINKVTGAGKPSATFEKTAALKKQLNTDLTTTIKELERVTADKGLIDQSTGSGAGRLADIGVGFFGGANEGAIATAKLRPIADMVLKMVPRFEGPQSDKDTASYKEAAGQLADPTVPNKIRKEAAIEIIRLMKDRKNQFVSDVMANEGMSAGGVDTSNPLLNLNPPKPK